MCSFEKLIRQGRDDVAEWDSWVAKKNTRGFKSKWVKVASDYADAFLFNLLDGTF